MNEELKQAAQQALEALEYMHKEKCDYMTRNKLGDPLKEDAARLAVPAMEALRRALTAAQPAQTERVAEQFEAMHAKGHVWISTIAASKLCRASLPTQPAAQATPEPVGEPVAWRYKIPTHGGGTAWTHTRPQPECLIEAQPLYTRPAPGVPMGDGAVQAMWSLFAGTNTVMRVDRAQFGALVQAIEKLALAAAQAKGADHG